MTPPDQLPPGDEWYRTDVNKGAISMRSFSRTLNDQRLEGYALHTVFAQGGNTVMVFEWVGRPGGS